MGHNGMMAGLTPDEYIAELDRRMLAAVLAIPFSMGPEPERCPVDGWPRARCLAFWGLDPVHEQQRLQAAKGSIAHS